MAILLRTTFRQLSPMTKTLLSPRYIVPLKNTSDMITNTMSSNSNEQNPKPIGMKQKLKDAVAQYGSTVIVFHVGISLISLGVCYCAVSTGLDTSALVEKLGLGESYEKYASNAGTFAVSYAVHKVFAPVRIGITLTATPFIVRYLRQIGFIKTSK